MIDGVVCGNASLAVHLFSAEQKIFACQQRRVEGKVYEDRRFFTGTGPILILTSYDSLDDPKFVEKLAAKGIRKFIAYEVPEERVRSAYREYFHIIAADLHPSDDLRVLDYDGHNVFHRFEFEGLGEPIYYEP